MTQILQDLVAKMDLLLPWLLPALESIEQTFPSTARISICVVLMAGLAFLRHRNLATAASNLHRATL